MAPFLEIPLQITSGIFRGKSISIVQCPYVDTSLSGGKYGERERYGGMGGGSPAVCGSEGLSRPVPRIVSFFLKQVISEAEAIRGLEG